MPSGAGQQPDITIVAHDIGPIGGMERQLSELIVGLLRDGHRVIVISRTCDLPAHPSLHWIRVRGPKRPFAIAYPWFLLLGSLIVKRRARGIVQSTGAIVINRVSINTVHYCHEAAARLSGFSRASRAGLAYRLNERVSKWMGRAGERLCYRPSRVEHLVGVSRGVAGELIEHFPDMSDRIRVIPNGVDTTVFTPAVVADRNGSDPDLTAIFVGSEWERKGLRIAIQAVRECPSARLMVVGAGDRAGFEGFATELGVSQRVRFFGTTDDVAGRYREADVLLLPTAYETFSLVTYEAAACGLPLLVTKVNGVEDLLEPGKHGWFVSRDAEDLAQRLRTLSEQPQLRREMGEAARRASERFSWRSVLEKYEGLYDEVATGTV